MQFAISKIVSSTTGAKSINTSGAAGNVPIPEYTARPDSGEGIQDYNPIPQNIAPIWPENSAVDIKIYVSPSVAMPALDKVVRETLVADEKNLTIGDWKDSREIDTTFDVPQEAQMNGTLWAHFYIALQGNALDPKSKDYDVAKAYHFFRPLNQILPKKKVVKTKKLLGGSDDTDSAKTEETPKGTNLASYYHPNFTMSFIPDSGSQSYVLMHPAVRQYVNLEATGARDASGQNGWYYPILFPNTFWQLRDHMTELNSTVKTLPLHITLNNLNNWKFSLYASIDDGMKNTQRQIANGGPVPAAGDGSEFEEFKRVLVDTNVYLLSTTFVVSILHMIFEGLAFKSDIVNKTLRSAMFIQGPQLTRLNSLIGGIKKITSVFPSAPSSPMSSCKASYSST